jgi:alkanesulfonate monooxygenase SsuD/methylene tetrahydromethanopterin reductase-like flavin-dependent oxidoreductase (luciferase family)
MYTWLTTHSGTPGNGDYLSKPWGLAEYGTVEGANPTDKAQWLENAVSTAQSQFPNLKALVYFDSNDSTNGRSCTWTVGSSSDSVAGFAAAGAESYVSATASTVVTTTTSTSTTTTTVPVTTTTQPPVTTTTTQPPVTTTTLTPPVISGAPVVTNDPTTVTVPLGGRVTFYSGAAGSPGPAVVWQLSENYGLTWWTLKQHTNPAYTVLHAAAADNGWEFRAVYSNPNGTVTTSVADLWVTVPTPVVVALG